MAREYTGKSTVLQMVRGTDTLGVAGIHPKSEGCSDGNAYSRVAGNPSETYFGREYFGFESMKVGLTFEAIVLLALAMAALAIAVDYAVSAGFGHVTIHGKDAFNAR
jgi:hypothetical protein